MHPLRGLARLFGCRLARAAQPSRGRRSEARGRPFWLVELLDVLDLDLQRWAVSAAGARWPTRLAARQFLTQCTHELARQADTHDIQRFWLRGEFRNHDLVLPVNEEVLAMNAEAEQHPRYIPLHVPLRPVVNRNVRKVASQVAGGPCLWRSIVADHVDPCCGHNLAAPMRAAFNEHLTDARKVPGCRAHAARRPRRTQSVDGDVSARRRAHRLPQMLAHEIGVAFAAAPLKDPTEQIRIG